MAIPVLFGILLSTFALGRLIPGDPCTMALGEHFTPESCFQYRERTGLNDSIAVQFVRYLGNLAHGNLGTSLRTSQPVVGIVLLRLPMTVELTISAMLFATVVGITLGIISATRHNSIIDVLTMIIANFGVSMPVLWLGIMLAYLFAIMLKGTPLWLAPSGRLTPGTTVTPLAVTFHLQNLSGIPQAMVTFASNLVVFNSLISGNWKVLGDALRHLILPSIAVGTIPMSIIARMTRSSLLEVLSADYVRTARAKGLHERAVLMTHAMKNAMLPIITVVGLEFGGLLAGAILTETIFSWPGMGRLVVERILARDYPTVQGAVLVIALLFVVLNLLVDLSYAYLDPRIRYE
jgi:peptide/nickel transport system permease protein